MSSPRRPVPSTQFAPWFNEFTVLGAFLAVALFGIVYGGVMAVTGWQRARPVMEVAAPSVDNFRSDVGDAAGPFLWQVSKSGMGMFAGDAELSMSLVSKTREQVLAINETGKIPAAESQAYLQLVLLLDRWTRALAHDATPTIRQAVVADTQAFILQNQWAVPAL